MVLEILLLLAVPAKADTLPEQIKDRATSEVVEYLDQQIRRKITNSRIEDGAVSSNKIADECAAGEVLKRDANDLSWICSTITGAGIGPDDVDTPKIKADSVTTAKIITGAVQTPKIDLGAVDTNRLNNDSVTAAKIIDAAISTPKLATDSVSATKILGGSVGTTKLAADSVTTTAIINSAIATSKLATDSVTTSAIINGAVTIPKLTDLTNINFWVGDANNRPVEQSLGPAFLSQGGGTVLASNSVAGSNISPGSVSSAKLSKNSVDSEKVVSGSIGNNHLANLTIQSAKIAFGAIDTNRLGSDAVTTPKIISGAVGTAKLHSEALNDSSKVASFSRFDSWGQSSVLSTFTVTQGSMTVRGGAAALLIHATASSLDGEIILNSNTGGANMFWQNGTSNQWGGLIRAGGANPQHLTFYNYGGGSMNIGTSAAAPTSLLHVRGTITQDTVKSCSNGLTTDSNGSINGCAASDRRLKRNIRPWSYDLSLLDRIQPVTYEWQDYEVNPATVTYMLVDGSRFSKKPTHVPALVRKAADDREHIGLIAQEVEALFPGAINGGGGDMKGIDNYAMLAILVQAVKDLRARVASLERMP